MFCRDEWVEGRKPSKKPFLHKFEMTMKSVLLSIAVILLWPCLGAMAVERPMAGHASWYGEEHRGKLMANGRPFDPRKMTAASWFYPLGTRVRVTLRDPALNAGRGGKRAVVVTITDRGPALNLVREGRIIDLGQAAFEQLAPAGQGLIPIQVRP